MPSSAWKKTKADENTKRIEELTTEIQRREREYKTVSVDYLTMKPTYFNSGCCCFPDGDITGIEIDNGYMRLVKWKKEQQQPARTILEEISLEILGTQV